MGRSPDILIFSDSSETTNIYRSYVSLGKCFIHFAGKNESGLQKLGNTNFDLIIVEISQPLLSEINFIEKLYSLNKYVPIVIVSEFFRETKNTVFGNKISEFISKPLTLDKLYETIHSVLEPGEAISGKKKQDTGERATFENKRLSVLYEISKSLNSITDFDKLLSTIVDLAIDAMNAERATLFVLDKSNDELWSRVGTGLERKEIRFSKNKGIAGEVVNKGISILSDNPYENPLFNKDFDIKSGFKTRNLVCVPMRDLEGSIVGAFQVLNKKEGRFTAEDELYLSAMAASTAIALENTLLHEEKKRKVEEMQKLYDDLYIAQNMIVWEAKHSTISEIRGFIKDLRMYEGVESIVKKLKNMENISGEVVNLADKIKESYHKTFTRIGEFLNRLITDLDSQHDIK